MCKYYKLRQRAKAGRLFIHPEYKKHSIRGYENTGRFDDADRLLTYCNHKPRQKRYQMLRDVAGLLQIVPRQLEKFIQEQAGKTIDDKLFHWISNIKTLKTNCGRAAKEQKKRRGRLRTDVQSVFGLIYYRKESGSLSDTDVKKILKESKVSEAFELYNFCDRAKKLCLEITEQLHDVARQKKWREDLEKNPASAVYFLAQINNLIFEERNGYARTCPVCSADNAQRMQTVEDTTNNSTSAKAQRLPAISTRVIDGAVKRMARIVGGEIAMEKWQKIENAINAGSKVCVPIIVESNRFEFEPNLRDLKKKATESDKEYKKTNPLRDKDKRIKEASNGVCPYIGKALTSGGEDKDHIIPRSSKWGTLNDEANLIWATVKGNQEIKRDREITLSDLHGNYKEKQFGTINDTEIEKWIIEQIGDGNSEHFTFGQYRSFINLTPEQQKAFRHALFLKGNPIRDKVIAAIDNRTRALVNGTQRYFAQSLADNLHRRAKKEGKEHLLSFDYFEIEAWDSSRGSGIKELREELVTYYRRDLGKFDKPSNASQELYSHLLDAQIAFCMALHEHQGDGSFKLALQENGFGLWSRVNRGELLPDQEGGVYDASLFNEIQVTENGFSQCELKRRKPYAIETHHRQQLVEGDARNQHRQKPYISYKIHRSNYVAEKFIPLIELGNGEIKKGFSADNCIEYKKSDFDMIKKFLSRSSKNENIWIVKKRQALSYLMEIGRKGSTTEEEKVAKLLDKLIYQTSKKTVVSILTRNSSAPKTVTVQEALDNWDECIKEGDFKKDGILLPVFFEWQKLKKELKEICKDEPDKDLQNFLSSCNLFKDKLNSNISNHNRKRKVYSLPVIASIGNIRLQRRSWNEQEIIQTTAEESFAKYGLDGKQRPHTILSKNSIPRKHYSGIPDNLPPEPIKWKTIPSEYLGQEAYKKFSIWSGKIIYQDANRCAVKLKVKDIINLSLPENEQFWEGRVYRHENEEKKTKNFRKKRSVKAV